MDIAATSEEYGAALRLARTGAGIGLRAFAREIGISPSTLSRIERGEPPDPKTAIILIHAAGVCPTCGTHHPKKELEKTLKQLNRADLALWIAASIKTLQVEMDRR